MVPLDCLDSEEKPEILENKVGLVSQEKQESPDFLDFLAHQEWLWTVLEDHLVSKAGMFIS